VIRGNKRNVLKQELNLNFKLHNKFEIEISDSETGAIKSKAEAYNIILDNYWTQLFSGYDVAYYIAYGSGTGTPAASDTDLFHAEGQKQRGGYTYDDTHFVEGWNSRTTSITLDETEAVGVTICEVGLKSQRGLTTHAMLQDMNGNPISIQKTNADILTIRSTVFFHWDVNGYANGKIKYIPSSHWFGIQPSASTLYISKGIAAGSLESLSLGASVSGNASQKKWIISGIHASAGALNVGGFRSILFTDGAFAFDLLGDYAVTSESVGTGDGSETDWPTKFELPVNGTVYIDGVASAGTISAKFKDQYIGKYMEGIDPQSTDAIHIPKQSALLDYNNSIKSTNSYYYNPYALGGNGAGVNYVYKSGQQIFTSNDMVTWIEIGAGSSGLITVPETYKFNKYWRVYANFSGYSTYPCYFVATGNYGNNVHFDEAPASGAVITADYTTPYVPKSQNNVWNGQITITLGAYTGGE